MHDDRLDRLFAAIDRKDLDAFTGFLAGGCRFRFGNMPAVEGRGNAAQAVAAFFQSVKTLRHEVTEALADGQKRICHGFVTYTRHDDSQLTVPFANLLTLDDDGTIGEYLIFTDISALHG